MFFIQRGHCEVLNDETGETLVELGEGQYFGEVAILCEARRNATVRSITEVDLLILTKADLDVVTRDYPKVTQKMTELALKRQQAIGAKVVKVWNAETNEADKRAAEASRAAKRDLQNASPSADVEDLKQRAAGASMVAAFRVRRGSSVGSVHDTNDPRGSLGSLDGRASVGSIEDALGSLEDHELTRRPSYEQRTAPKTLEGGRLARMASKRRTSSVGASLLTRQASGKNADLVGQASARRESGRDQQRVAPSPEPASPASPSSAAPQLREELRNFSLDLSAVEKRAFAEGTDSDDSDEDASSSLPSHAGSRRASDASVVKVSEDTSASCSSPGSPSRDPGSRRGSDASATAASSPSSPLRPFGNFPVS